MELSDGVIGEEGKPYVNLTSFDITVNGQPVSLEDINRYRKPLLCKGKKKTGKSIQTVEFKVLEWSMDPGFTYYEIMKQKKFDPGSRGIWVESDDAWYHLMNPHPRYTKTFEPLQKKALVWIRVHLILSAGESVCNLSLDSMKEAYLKLLKKEKLMRKLWEEVFEKEVSQFLLKKIKKYVQGLEKKYWDEVLKSEFVQLLQQEGVNSNKIIRSRKRKRKQRTGNDDSRNLSIRNKRQKLDSNSKKKGYKKILDDDKKKSDDDDDDDLFIDDEDDDDDDDEDEEEEEEEEELDFVDEEFELDDEESEESEKSEEEVSKRRRRRLKRKQVIKKRKLPVQPLPPPPPPPSNQKKTKIKKKKKTKKKKKKKKKSDGVLKKRMKKLLELRNQKLKKQMNRKKKKKKKNINDENNSSTTLDESMKKILEMKHTKKKKKKKNDDDDNINSSNFSILNLRIPKKIKKKKKKKKKKTTTTFNVPKKKTKIMTPNTPQLTISTRRQIPPNITIPTPPPQEENIEISFTPATPREVIITEQEEEEQYEYNNNEEEDGKEEEEYEEEEEEEDEKRPQQFFTYDNFRKRGGLKQKWMKSSFRSRNSRTKNMYEKSVCCICDQIPLILDLFECDICHKGYCTYCIYMEIFSVDSSSSSSVNSNNNIDEDHQKEESLRVFRNSVLKNGYVCSKCGDGKQKTKTTTTSKRSNNNNDEIFSRRERRRKLLKKSRRHSSPPTPSRCYDPTISVTMSYFDDGKKQQKQQREQREQTEQQQQQQQQQQQLILPPVPPKKKEKKEETIFHRHHHHHHTVPPVPPPPPPPLNQNKGLSGQLIIPPPPPSIVHHPQFSQQQQQQQQQRQQIPPPPQQYFPTFPPPPPLVPQNKNMGIYPLPPPLPPHLQANSSNNNNPYIHQQQQQQAPLHFLPPPHPPQRIIGGVMIPPQIPHHHNPSISINNNNNNKQQIHHHHNPSISINNNNNNKQQVIIPPLPSGPPIILGRPGLGMTSQPAPLTNHHQQQQQHHHHNHQKQQQQPNTNKIVNRPPAGRRDSGYRTDGFGEQHLLDNIFNCLAEGKVKEIEFKYVEHRVLTAKSRRMTPLMSQKMKESRIKCIKKQGNERRRLGITSTSLNVWKERSLFLYHVEFLTRALRKPWMKDNTKTFKFFYLISSGGRHIPRLAEMFRQVEFYIFPWDEEMSKSLPEIELMAKEKYSIHVSKRIYFLNPYVKNNNNNNTTTTRKKFLDYMKKEYNYIIGMKNLLLSCDFRVVNVDPNNNKNPFDESRIKEMMKEQREIFKELRPVASLLQFIPPRYDERYYDEDEEDDLFEYLNGDVVLPIWGDPHSYATKLGVFSDVARNFTFRLKRYEDQIRFFHDVSRLRFYDHNLRDAEGIDHCYDCRCEIFVLMEYLRDFRTSMKLKKEGIKIYSKRLSREIEMNRTLKDYQNF